MDWSRKETMDQSGSHWGDRRVKRSSTHLRRAVGSKGGTGEGRGHRLVSHCMIPLSQSSGYNIRARQGFLICIPAEPFSQETPQEEQI